jgi:hypothetical protein
MKMEKTDESIESMEPMAETSPPNQPQGSGKSAGADQMGRISRTASNRCEGASRRLKARPRKETVWGRQGCYCKSR